MTATADVHQKDRTQAQSKRVKAHILENGNLIFSWLDGADRKMVLTTNTGNTIKDGHLGAGELEWTNPDSWKIKSVGFYSIKHFQPRQGMSYLCIFNFK